MELVPGPVLCSWLAQGEKELRPEWKSVILLSLLGGCCCEIKKKQKSAAFGPVVDLPSSAKLKSNKQLNHH